MTDSRSEDAEAHACRQLLAVLPMAATPLISVSSLSLALDAGLSLSVSYVADRFLLTRDGFAAYAKMRVRGAMVDLIRRHVPLSRGAVERRRTMREKQAVLRGQLGRDPYDTELAAAMGLTLAELEGLRSISEPLRFEGLDEAYSDSSMAFADDRPDSLALLEDQELRASVAGAIGDLPERLQMVIQLYFVEELNLAEIAEVLSVSIPRVHQLKAQALDRLRAALAGVAEIL